MLIFMICTRHQIEDDERGGACGMQWGEKRNACRAWVGKLEGKKPPGIARRRCLTL